MDVKSNVKRRRQERIKQLTAMDATRTALPGWNNDPELRSNAANIRTTYHSNTETHVNDELGPDPELLWKKGQGRWKDTGALTIHDEHQGGNPSSFWTAMFIKLVISALLFGFIWGVNRYEPEWAFPIRIFVAEALTKEMDFGAVESWYESTFGGAPSFIPIFKHSGEKGLKVDSTSGFASPLQGTLASSFALSLKGVEIIPDNHSDNGSIQIKSANTGKVVSVTRDALTGMTVVVQHAGGYESVYGHLDQPTVEKGDWVEVGDMVGILSVKSEPPYPTLYFAIKNNDRYIDPVDVISFD